MVKATTLEILANFRAVMAELVLVHSCVKVHRGFMRKYNGKRFPCFVGDDFIEDRRERTTKRLLQGKYYYSYRPSDADVPKYILRRDFKIDNVRYRKTDRRPKENGKGMEEYYSETEAEYNEYVCKLLIVTLKEKDPEVYKYYKMYVAEAFESKLADHIKYKCIMNEKTLKEYHRANYRLISLFLNRQVPLPCKEAINPYYSTYCVERKTTNVCKPKFYSHLFTGDYNFSLMKIKYAKGGKITNAGLKATEYYYYNGDKSNWSFESHSKVYDLAEMCKRNNIAVPKGKGKYEDLAALLKQLP
jgi:hypothetical protein